MVEIVDNGYLFVHFLKDKGEGWLFQLANTPSLLSTMCLVYSFLVPSKKVTAIELIEVDEKMELFNEAKRLSKDHSKKHIIKVCKALYTMGSLIQLDDKEFQMRVEKFLSAHEIKQ